MDERTWRSVFKNMTQACGELGSYKLDLLYDPGVISVVDEGLQTICLREENDVKAVRILLCTLRPSKEAQKAMREFCCQNGLHRLLATEEAQRDTGAVRLCRSALSSSSLDARQPDEHSGFVLRDKKTKLFQKAFRNPSFRTNLVKAVENVEERKAIRETPLTLPVACLCFGRSDEVDLMGEAFRTATKPTNFAIVGGGGMGKTSLATAVTHDERIADVFGQRRYWVNLEGCSAQTALIESIVRVLPISAGSDMQVVRSFLAPTPALLVLDDLDALAADDHHRAGLSSVLDSIASACSLIVTLRDAHPLPTQLIWHKKVRLDRLDPVSAARTFCAIADGHEDDPDLAALMEQCDGMPLAIRLLSHQAAAGEPLSQLRRRWDKQRHRFLSARVPGTKLDNLAVSIELTLTHPRIETDEDAWTLLRLLAPLIEGLSFSQLDQLFEGIGAPSALGTLLDLGLIHRQQRLSTRNGDSRYSMVTPVRTYILDTVRCPSPWTITDALEAGSEAAIQDGVSFRRMRVFEMMNAPLIPQCGGLLCIAIADVRTNSHDPITLGFRFRLWGVDDFILFSPPGLVADTNGCGPAFPLEYERLAGLDAVAESLCRLRDRLAQTESCEPLFSAAAARLDMKHAIPDTQILGFLDPLYNWLRSDPNGLSEGTVALNNASPTFVCFMMPPTPGRVTFDVVAAPRERPESGVRLKASSLFYRSWVPEELLPERASYNRYRSKSTPDCDRASAYFASCLQAIDGYSPSDDREREPEYAAHPDSLTLSFLRDRVVNRLQEVAASAIAVCIKEGNRPEAQQRLYAEAQVRGIHQDIAEVAEYLLAEGSKLVNSPNRRVYFFPGGYLLSRHLAGEAFRSGFREAFADRHPGLEKLCAECLDALAHDLPPSPREDNPFKSELNMLALRLRSAFYKATRTSRRG